jgi:hypothetical protein
LPVRSSQSEPVETVVPITFTLRVRVFRQFSEKSRTCFNGDPDRSARWQSIEQAAVERPEMRSCISVYVFVLATTVAQAQTVRPHEQPVNDVGYNVAGREVMRSAMDMAAQGDVAGATSLAGTAMRMPVEWGPEEPTPGQFISGQSARTTDGEYHYSDAIPIPQLTSGCQSTQPVCPPSAMFARPQETWPIIHTCNSCDTRGSIWYEAEYMYWWIREPEVAPLATTSSAGTPEDEAGILGLPGTSVLVGNNQILDTERSGFRLTLGWQIEPHFRFLTSFTRIAGGTGSLLVDYGNAILARPFDNLDLGNDAELISYPGLMEGSLTFGTDRHISTLEYLFERSMGTWRSGFLDASIGYRYLRLDDRLTIVEQSFALGGATAGTRTRLVDDFVAANRFHGLTFGLNMHWHRGRRWIVELNGKLSYGNARRVVRIDGATVTTDAGGTTILNRNGLLTQPTNIGVHSDNKLTYVAELGVLFKYRLNDRTFLTCGYTALNVDKVARASDQIDFTVNTTQIPPGTLDGAARPRFRLVESELLAHALRFGVEYSY